MFQSLKIKDLIQLVFIVILAIVFAFLYVNNQARNTLWLKTYPVRAIMSKSSIQCSEDSPSWMSKVLEFQVDQTAPSNQIAFIDNTGNLHHCENGFVGEYPYLSASVTEKTRFRYASVTKLWTADAILDLIKQEKLQFGTPLVSILTEIKNPKDPRINEITIGQLLLHRAGFDRYSMLGQDMFGIGKEICPNHIELLNTTRLGFTPDEKVSYSNLGYCLLGEVVSRLEDKPYKDFMTEKYDMDNSGLKFISNTRMEDEVFYNHIETGITGAGDIYTVFNYDDLASAAGLSGSAVALAKQVKTMISQPEPNILSLNNKYTCDLNKLRDCYGYAMFPYQRNDLSPKVFFRDGNLLGLSTLVMITENGEVIALLSNGISPQSNDATKLELYNTFVMNGK